VLHNAGNGRIEVERFIHGRSSFGVEFMVESGLACEKAPGATFIPHPISRIREMHPLGSSAFIR
jgi:hypothetical protein